jgi:hypothetical protein
MGRAATHWVRENFDIVKRTEMLERFYDDVLQPTSAALVQ